jgi:hypothetical protein
MCPSLEATIESWAVARCRRNLKSYRSTSGARPSQLRPGRHRSRRALLYHPRSRPAGSGCQRRVGRLRSGFDYDNSGHRDDSRLPPGWSRAGSGKSPAVACCAWRNQPAVRSDASHAAYRSLMVESSQVIPRMSAAENVSTIEWRGLHLHVVTLEPLSPDQVRDIKRSLVKVSSVGQAADILGMILGRSVRIRTERPSLDVRLEVGR